MNAPSGKGHSPGLQVAQNEIGAVSVCACGVVTLTLQYLSLRFEPDAFGQLQQLLLQAHARMGRHDGAQAGGDTAPGDSEAAAPASLPLRRVH